MIHRLVKSRTRQGERMTNPPDIFDAVKVVMDYRRVIARRDAATAKPRRTERDTKAKRLRESWKKWQGEDSLHEMAFGEPEE